MSYDRTFVGAWLLALGFIAVGLIHEGWRQWRRRKTWRRFNRDERRVVMDAERYRKLAP